MASEKYNQLVNITKKKQTSGYQWGEGKGEVQYMVRELRDINYEV